MERHFYLRGPRQSTQITDKNIMFLLLSSFLAGMLTALAPCMITLLPVIVGNSVLPGQDKEIDRKKPYVIAASLGISVILFTLILNCFDRY
jgi:cytochrome c biogenesis protein CcdA